MKKMVLVTVLAIIGSVVFGQARTNDPLPSEFVLLAELTEATGWIKSDGEWKGNPNKLITDEQRYFPDRFNNFKAIRVYETTYVGARYIVLELLYEFYQAGGSYSWAGNQLLRSGSFNGIYKEYYVFDPVKFIIQVDETGQSVINNEITYMQNISRVKEGEDPGFSVWFRNMKEYSFNTFNFYTQYWKEDNVVRFYAGSSISAVSSLQYYDIMEEYYYERDAVTFFNVFNKFLVRK